MTQKLSPLTQLAIDLAVLLLAAWFVRLKESRCEPDAGAAEPDEPAAR